MLTAIKEGGADLREKDVDDAPVFTRVAANRQIFIKRIRAQRWAVVDYQGREYFVLLTQLEPLPSHTATVPGYSGSSSSSNTIYTGPRGGRYYINKNGNKTYIKKR